MVKHSRDRCANYLDKIVCTVYMYWHILYPQNRYNYRVSIRNLRKYFEKELGNGLVEPGLTRGCEESARTVFSSEGSTGWASTSELSHTVIGGSAFSGMLGWGSQLLAPCWLEPVLGFLAHGPPQHGKLLHQNQPGSESESNVSTAHILNVADFCWLEGSYLRGGDLIGCVDRRRDRGAIFDAIYHKSM
jgi:hypothetical protein